MLAELALHALTPATPLARRFGLLREGIALWSRGLRQRKAWEPHQARCRAIIAEVAGSEVAEANAEAKAQVQRGILVDCLTGSNGRAKAEGWLPRWFASPSSGYTTRGGVGCVERSEHIAALVAQPEVAEEPELREAA